MPQYGVVKYADGNESRLFMAIRCINNHDSIATLVMLKSILDPIKSHSRTNWSVETLGLSIDRALHSFKHQRPVVQSYFSVNLGLKCNPLF